MPRDLRLPRRALPLLGLTLALGLLAPLAAPAGQSRHASQRARGHASIARGRCALKRRNKPSSRASSTNASSSHASSNRASSSRGSSTRSPRTHQVCAKGRPIPSSRALAKRTSRPSKTRRPREPPAAPGAGTPPATPSPPVAPSPAPEGAAPSLFAPGGAETDPIDPRYLTATPFGTSSFWIQPWRAYLDTWPASRLLESLGINFNVHAAEAEGDRPTAAGQRLQARAHRDQLGRALLRRPDQFVNEADIRTRLVALHKHGLRPLILLDANSTGPAPAKQVTLKRLAAAPAGAQTRDAERRKRRRGRARQDRLRRALLRR